MKLIVGLGNPGEKYEKTRHNLGFMLVEHFLHDFTKIQNTVWENNKKLKSDLALLNWQPKHGKSERVILAKPKTFMNNSGMAVALIADFYKVKPEDIWILHDEIDLPIGTLKIRFGGGTAGHHGVESVLGALGTDKFWRFRLGIGEQKNDQARHFTKHIDTFVVKDFTGSEQRSVRELIKRGVKALEEALEKDLQHAMNQYNAK